MTDPYYGQQKEIDKDKRISELEDEVEALNKQIVDIYQQLKAKNASSSQSS